MKVNVDRRKLIEAATAKALREAQEAYKARVGNVSQPKKPCGCKDKVLQSAHQGLTEEIDPVPTPGQNTASPLSTLSPEERTRRQFERMTGKKWTGNRKPAANGEQV